MNVNLFVKQTFYLFIGILFLTAFSANIETFFGENDYFSWIWSIKSSFLLDIIIITTIFIYSSLSINNCELQKPNRTVTLFIILTVLFYTYEKFNSKYVDFTSFKMSTITDSSFQIAYLDIIYWIAILHFGLYFKYLRTSNLIENNNVLLEDNPIQYESEDELNGLFNIPTEKIYKIIKENKFKTSFTIGLNSEWGDGKTSVFNFVRNKLENEKDIITVDFNPWIGFDKKVLIKDFFNSLGESLGSNFSSEFSDYTSIILNNGDEISFVKIIRTLIQKKDDSLVSKFDEINDKIGRLNKKIIVFIDDVDRLDKEEVFEILKLIRKTANFKNTFFVVAYDRNYVNNSIKDQSGASTIKYLDKIINVEIALPYFDKYALKEYFATKLKKVIPENLHFKVDYFTKRDDETFDLGLGFEENDLFEYWLNNFREIKKIVNSISVNYYKIYADVNFKDLILLEILKLKHPQLHTYLFVKQNEILSVNRALYCYYLTPLDKVKASNKRFLEFLENTSKSKEYSTSEMEKTVTVFDFYLEQYTEINKINNIEKERIIDLIDRLFLRWDEDKTVTDEISNDSEKDLRVRYVNKFERYFSHTIFMNNISEEEFQNFIIGNPPEIYQKVEEWTNKGKLKDLCFRLNRNFHFRTEIEYKNTIIISLKLLEIQNGPINFYQLISKMIGLKLYPDIFTDIQSASTFFKEIFSSAISNSLIKAQILNELRKRNDKRNDDDVERFPLTDAEIDNILLKYVKEKITSNIIYNNEFWSLYFACQKVDENRQRKPYEEINSLLHENLEISEQVVPFLKSLIIYENYGYESLIRKGAIENLFGSMEDFETDFLKKLPESAYLKEFIKYYTKSKEENWNHIEFDYEFIKQSIY